MTIEPFIETIKLNRIVRHYRRITIINNVSSIILLSFLFLFTIFFYNWYFYDSPAKIDYSNVSIDNEIYAKTLIDKINPDCLSLAREIKFIQDYKQIERNKDKDKYIDPIVIGFTNVATKKIIIYLSGDTVQDISLIQHELAHTILMTSRDEEIAELLEKTTFCLKPEIKRMTIEID